jgi:iron complex outermembrane receptor protein
MKLFHANLLSSAMCAGVIGLIAQPAFAQTTGGSAGIPVQADAQPDNGGDIIVTANRREELSQKVGVSITAVSGALLDDRNIRSAEDLGRLIPGLNATAATGSSVATFVIRGVGQTDFSDHQEQPNASYQDGVYIPFATATGVPLFDIQRVEALRGPQGTLFGRNATGGLIQYISNKPDAGTSAAIEGAYGTRDLKRVQGFVNAGNDLIAGRLAFYYQAQDGYVKNVLGPDRGNKTVYALRGQVQIKPTENTTITLRVDGFNQSGTPSGYIATPEQLGAVNSDLPANVDAYGTGPGNDPNGYRSPYNSLTVALDEPGYIKKRARTYAGTIEQSIGDLTLTSVTAYATIFSNYLEDTDSTPLDTFTAESTSKAHDFQQELRISGSTDRLRYTAGLFYLDINGNYALNNNIVVSPSLATIFGISPGRVLEASQYSLRTRSEAVYGQLEYDLGSKFTAILGGRYTWDQMKFNFGTTCAQTVPGVCPFFGGDPNPALEQVGIGPLALRDNQGDWSGKAQLNFKPTDNVLLYASVSKGVKSSGFSAPLANAVPGAPINYKPENLYAYEVGEKAQFLDKRVTLNTSFYYYDYRDFQSFLFQTVATQVLNRDSEAYGGELELSVRPGRGFSANLGAAYNHFRVKEVFPGIDNQRPINGPRGQLNWGIDKSVDLNDDLKLEVGYAGRYISSVYYNLINTPLTKAAPYSVSDFSARLSSKHGWYVAAYLNNAFDKRYQVGAFDTFLGYGLRQFGEIRTFSGAVGMKF